MNRRIRVSKAIIIITNIIGAALIFCASIIGAFIAMYAIALIYASLQ